MAAVSSIVIPMTFIFPLINNLKAFSSFQFVFIKLCLMARVMISYV